MTTDAGVSHRRLFIGGEWVASRGETVAVVNPTDEQVIGSVTSATAADAQAAIAAARSAFDAENGWRTWPASERSAALERLAELLEERGSEIAQTVSRQNGMPISLSRALEAGFPPLLLRYYAELARGRKSVTVRPGMLGGQVEIRCNPVGVVAAITPWNFPQTLAAMKYAPALAAGCTVVVKPALETPLDSVILAECVKEAKLPPGVISILPGGTDVGRLLVSHPDVDKVAFTGSTQVGKEIAQTCASRLRPVTLELGGKSAAIILDDAPLDDLREQLFGALFLHNGQTCFLSSRVLAPMSRYQEVIEFLADLAGNARLGDPLDEQTMIGPLVNAKQRSRVESYIEAGKSDGCRLVSGGQRPDRPGFFVAPTVFADVDNSHRIAREEIFGPVITAIAYETEAEAIQIANDSTYGLGGTVWSADKDHAADIARRIYTGTIGINGYTPDPAGPFGGVKQSGLGREFSTEGFTNYLESQTVYH